MTVLMTALGAAVGAPLRYFADRFVRSRCGSVFPWGTYAVNVASCLLLGFVGALALPPWAVRLAGTGFLGALSTYSAFGAETFRLLERGRVFLACANAAASLGVGLGAVVLGAVVGQAFSG